MVDMILDFMTMIIPVSIVSTCNFDRFGFMVFNATFKNISVILWWSVLLVEETGEPGENHRPVTSH